jgi:glutathione S-transferase
MKLIGMLDSPYVRRAHITAAHLGLACEHEALSVFRHFDAFHKINPIVKAPTLLTDDGTVLVDSSLIIDYFESKVMPEKRLLPSEPDARARALHIIGFALAACDKTAAIVYEQQLRPEEKQHQPWLDRLQGQLLDAYRMLETSAAGAITPWLAGQTMTQADITLAVAWRFTQHMLPEVVAAASFPALVAFSAEAEKLPVFLAAPL